MIQRLQRLVRLPSVSGSEGPIADAFAAELAGMGFSVSRSGHNLFFQAVAGPGPTLLFNSHLDTIPACAGWTLDPHAAALEDGRIVGLGANDAKGCVVALLEAACALRDRYAPRTGVAAPGSLWVAFSAAEETGGEGLATILPQLPALDAAVVGEPTSCVPVLAQKGLLVLKGTARGVAGHAAHGEQGGARNAVHAAARDVAGLSGAALPGEHALLGPQTLQVTVMHGGAARNAVPDLCEFWVDVRTNPGAEPESLAAHLARGLESRLEVHSRRLVAVETDPAQPIARAAAVAAGTPGTGSRTVSDWVHLKGVPTVKIGPGDTARSHRADEFITVDELRRGAAVYTALAESYFALAREEKAAWR